ncbi:NAD(P)H-hydrate dehydratase [Methyloglobulus sp.]|uniref:NAD(P)H-hydrate dehydratase n=1 Tax=Methyloglobulus sp. TaxID=2518622 RepID=UPI0039890885
MQKLPTELYRADQVRELDHIVIKEYGIPGIELMSRAGNAVFRHLRIKWPNAKSISVFCGSGNNAGDGYIIAGLAQVIGLKVTVYALSDPENLKDNALIAYQDYINANGTITPFQVDQAIYADVVIDALLGTGLNKSVTGIYAQAIHNINKCRSHVIAVDVPSGLNADTGSVMACAVKATCTVTFIGLKQGLYTGLAADYCGEILYSSLAVPKEIFEKVATNTHRVVKKIFPPRSRCAHKGDHGHVLIVGGDRGYSGAARMAGEAALRVGAGLVSVATHPEHAALLNLNRPELMCHGVDNAGQLSPLLDKADVIVIGPGLGQSKWATVLFIAAIKSSKMLVIDADGLNLLAHVPEKHPDWVLTPHPGEAARLLRCATADVQQDRYAAVAAIQAKYDGIAVLKGSGTLIAGNDDVTVSTTGNPGMASGGMGDVLAGVIAGLAAQGFSLKDAAQQGVYLHGMAADLAVGQTGERGLLASDLMPFLRQLVN